MKVQVKGAFKSFFFSPKRKTKSRQYLDEIFFNPWCKCAAGASTPLFCSSSNNISGQDQQNGEQTVLITTVIIPNDIPLIFL